MTENQSALLVVDDNEDNRYTLMRRLKREGYTDVPFAENGQEALDRPAEQPFDLVLLDIMMPVLNGYETLERITSDMWLREIPVIMISAVDEMDSVVRCIEGGAEDHLPKPFNAALLRARIHASLEKKRLRDQEAGYLKQIEVEKKRADDLLHATLPAAAVHELKATNVVRPRRFEDVAVLFCDHHVAQIDPDAELDPVLFWNISVAFGYCSLCFHGRPNGIHDARELGKHAVAHELDDSPVMLGERRIDEISAQNLERRQRTFLVGPDQARVADYVRGQNGSETAFHDCLPG